MLNSADPNDITLASYNAEIKGYIKHTPAEYQKYHKPMLDWIDASLNLLDKNDRILEIGSGSGRDAAYIRSKGYNIVCSDGAPAFVDYLNARGWDAKALNILKDEIPSGFKMIFANAVIPHLTAEQFEFILSKTMGALPRGGLFAFSIKQGRGDDWITEKFDAKRYIHYWSPNALKECIKRNKCEIVVWKEGITGDLPSHTWTDLTLRKI